MLHSTPHDVSQADGHRHLVEHPPGGRSADRAGWFPFATRNRSVFHDPSGAGYRVFVDEVIELMLTRADLVIRLAGDLLQLRRFDEHRRALMRAELERMADAPGMLELAMGIVRGLLAAS